MTPHDEERFKTFIQDFIDGCNFELPFFVVLIGANGSISVARYTADGGVEPLCEHVVGKAFTPPIVITAIARKGTARTAQITIEIATPTLQ